MRSEAALARALREGADRLDGLMVQAPELHAGETIVGELGTGTGNKLRVVAISRPPLSPGDAGYSAISIQTFKAARDGEWFRSGPNTVIHGRRLGDFARLVSRALDRLEGEISDHRRAAP